MKLLKLLPRFRQAYASLAELAERETWSRAQVEAYQLERLNALWEQATRHVPHYRELCRAARLPERFDDRDQFSALVPILPKALVRSRPELFLADHPSRGEWLYTSGATGSPTPIYHAHDAHRAMLRSRYRFYQMWNVDVLDRWAYVWGNARAFEPGLAGWKARIETPVQDRLRNRVRLSPYDLRQRTLRRNLARIASSRPVALYSHSMAAYLLALEAGEVGFRCPSLQVVVLTAEPARPRVIEAVERGFGVPAVVEYGATERGLLAGEWPDRTLRVREDGVLLETVPRPDGRFDILLTVLDNPSFPLIRYAIGDVSDRPLTRPAEGFAILGAVSGRDYDFILTRSGEILHGQVFEDLLDKHRFIRRWRLAQDADGAVSVLLECHGSPPAERLRSLDRRFRDLVDGYAVTLRTVDCIPHDRRGKHRSVSSELAARWRQEVTQ